MKDIRQTPEYADYLSKLGWKTETLGGVNYFIRKLPIFGSFIKIQRPERVEIKTVNQLAKQYKAFQVVIEPKNKNQELRLKNYGFKRTGSPFLPSLTLHLNLNSSKEKLLKGLKKDARAAIKKNHVLRIVNSGGKISEFRNIWKKTVGLKRYVPPLSHLEELKRSFDKNALFLTSKDSGAIFIKADKIAYYWQAFTGKEGRRNQIQYKIVWEGILWAKKRGAKLFDFEGIYDYRFPNKSWQGFTHFKKSFDGYQVEYPGALVRNSIIGKWLT